MSSQNREDIVRSRLIVESNFASLAAMATVVNVALRHAGRAEQVLPKPHAPRDANGSVIVRREIKGRYVFGVLLEAAAVSGRYRACASSHHRSRELKALGNRVRLMPPAYVKPYVKRQKNDAADAEAICKAVARANMRFIETKTPEQ